MGELVKQASIRVILPAMERQLPFHTSNLLSNFSSKVIQSATCSLLGLTGTPKDFIGKIPTWQLTRSENFLAISLSPFKTNILGNLSWDQTSFHTYKESFSDFLLSPNHHLYKWWYHQHIVRLWDHRGSNEYKDPQEYYFSELWQLTRSLARLSTTKFKRMGERGSPCLTRCRFWCICLFCYSVLHLQYHQ